MVTSVPRCLQRDQTLLESASAYTGLTIRRSMMVSSPTGMSVHGVTRSSTVSAGALVSFLMHYLWHHSSCIASPGRASTSPPPPPPPNPPIHTHPSPPFHLPQSHALWQSETSADDGDVEERTLYKEKIRKPLEVDDPSHLKLKWLPRGTTVQDFINKGRFRSRELKEKIVGLKVMVYVDLPGGEPGWRTAMVKSYNETLHSHVVSYTDSEASAATEDKAIDYTDNVMFLLKPEEDGASGPSGIMYPGAVQVGYVLMWSRTRGCPLHVLLSLFPSSTLCLIAQFPRAAHATQCPVYSFRLRSW